MIRQMNCQYNYMNHIANTIDEKHTELLNEFHRNETTLIPELKMKITEKKMLF
jgi:hypothetical protein